MELPNYNNNNNKIQINGMYALSQISQYFRRLKKVNPVILGDSFMFLVPSDPDVFLSLSLAHSIL